MLDISDLVKVVGVAIALASPFIAATLATKRAKAERDSQDESKQWRAISSNEKRINELKIEIAKEFVTKVDLEKSIKSISDQIDRGNHEQHRHLARIETMYNEQQKQFAENQQQLNKLMIVVNRALKAERDVA